MRVSTKENRGKEETSTEKEEMWNFPVYVYIKSGEKRGKSKPKLRKSAEKRNSLMSALMAGDVGLFI